MKFFLTLLAATAVLAAQDTRQTITGVITESECATANHALMKMGDTDEECAKACVDSHGATWVLFDGKVSWALTDQKAPAQFAGKRVVVSGVADQKAKKITVESVAAAK